MRSGRLGWQGAPRCGAAPPHGGGRGAGGGREKLLAAVSNNPYVSLRAIFRINMVIIEVSGADVPLITLGN